MNRDSLSRLLVECHRAISHKEFVIMGSLSILGKISEPPSTMVVSVDVDIYPKLDPGRAGELNAPFGWGSPFEKAHGYYADPVSPSLPCLPEGWESRLLKLEFDSGVIAWCLEPNDAAISKYTRNEPRDRRWIRSGLKHGLLSLPTIEYRLRET